MKKLMILSILSLFIVACASTETTTEDKLSREAGTQWWREIGEPDSEYWWIAEYEDEQSD